VSDLIGRFLSLDDLWSVLGYALLVILARVSNPAMGLPAASLLASGMLAIVWFAGGDLRARNLERHPNARVVAWALVAVVSALLVVR
jgi:hypothetical protein